MLYSLCTIYWHVIHSTIHFSYISHSISLSCSYEAKASLYTNICTTYYLTFWYTYFDRNICWPMVIGGNQSSFRARNKSRTAIISIHDQPSILSLWNEVDCYVQPAEEDTHFTFVRLCIDIRLAPINSMLTTFSVPTQYDIYFFHVWQFVLLLLEWGWLLCAASWKISQFHLWYVIVHVVRSVHSGMQRTATSVPTQYYIYLSAALFCFDQASWWVV